MRFRTDSKTHLRCIRKLKAMLMQKIRRISGFPRIVLLFGAVGIGIVIFFRASLERTPFAFFYMDDFIGIQTKLNTFEFVTTPYGGHISYGVVIWVMFLRFFGASRYYPFMVLALSLTVVNALFLGNVLRRISSHGVAAIAVLWLLFLGPAFHNQLWDQASLSQLASISIFGIAVLNQAQKFYIFRCLLLAFIGFGVGGLGFGVAVALIMLLFLERHFLVSAFMTGAIFFLCLIANSSLSGTGNNPISIKNISTVPYYMVSALSGTIQAAANLPIGVAEILAVGVLVFSIPAVPIAYTKLSETAARAFFLSGFYLLVTWVLAALVRGDLVEVAAPRYVGVTAPLLLVYTVALLHLLNTSMARPPSGYTRLFELQKFPKILVVLIALASLSNLGTWLSSRENANYLGAINIAKLAAINAAEDWINPDFKPTGEGLNYVTASLINSAWRTRGVPDFSGFLNIKYPFRELRNTVFISTLLEAGLVSLVPSSSTISKNVCRDQLVLSSSDFNEIHFYDIDSEITIRNRFSEPLSISGSSGSGILRVEQVKDESKWILDTTSGCLTSEKIP